jgi:uncharacterized protein (UPF0218 family)
MDDDVVDLRPVTRYRLPAGLRDSFSEDFGPIVADDDIAAAFSSNDLIIAVGDIVSMDLQQRDIEPRIFVCDYKTHRDEENPEFRDALSDWGDKEIQVMNPAGTITRKAWSAIQTGLAREGITRIVVNGEEDLLGIPAFLEAPDGAKVIYGSPGKGAVIVEVNAALRKRVLAILAKFEKE